MLNVTPTIKSPCRLICEMDITHGLCKGCGRSRAEIARWTRFTDAERETIMNGLEDRMKKHGFTVAETKSSDL